MTYEAVAEIVQNHAVSRTAAYFGNLQHSLARTVAALLDTAYIEFSGDNVSALLTAFSPRGQDSPRATLSSALASGQGRRSSSRLRLSWLSSGRKKLFYRVNSLLVSTHPL